MTKHYPQIKIKKHSDNRSQPYFFELYAANGYCTGWSEDYSSYENAQKGAQSFLKNGSNPQRYDKTKEGAYYVFAAKASNGEILVYSSTKYKSEESRDNGVDHMVKLVSENPNMPIEDYRSY